MKTSEFKKIAKQENVNVYSVRKISEKGNAGYRISYSKQLSYNAVSTKKEIEFFTSNLIEVANQLQSF